MAKKRKLHFLEKDAILILHQDEIATFGGINGFLDESLLDSALEQPLWALRCESPSLYDLAAVYGYHLYKNHAFLDGNKRTASATMILFLRMNGITVFCSDDEIEAIIVAVANNEVGKQQLSAWLRSVSRLSSL